MYFGLLCLKFGQNLLFGNFSNFDFYLKSRFIQYSGLNLNLNLRNHIGTQNSKNRQHMLDHWRKHSLMESIHHCLLHSFLSQHRKIDFVNLEFVSVLTLKIVSLQKRKKTNVATQNTFTESCQKFVSDKWTFRLRVTPQKILLF